MLAYCLILWILDYSSDGNGYGFPFDQRYLNFYQRLKAAQTLINQVKAYYPVQTENDVIIWKLYHLIEKIVGDSSLKSIVLDYKVKLAVFSDLRRALGVAPEPAQNGLTQMSTISSTQELQKIRTAVKDFMSELDQKINSPNDSKMRRSFISVKERLEKYWQKLSEYSRYSRQWEFRFSFQGITSHGRVALFLSIFPKHLIVFLFVWHSPFS